MYRFGVWPGCRCDRTRVHWTVRWSAHRSGTGHEDWNGCRNGLLRCRSNVPRFDLVRGDRNGLQSLILIAMRMRVGRTRTVCFHSPFVALLLCGLWGGEADRCRRNHLRVGAFRFRLQRHCGRQLRYRCGLPSGSQSLGANLSARRSALRRVRWSAFRGRAEHCALLRTLRCGKRVLWV